MLVYQKEPGTHLSKNWIYKFLKDRPVLAREYNCLFESNRIKIIIPQIISG